jgi:hypothetical protein
MIVSSCTYFHEGNVLVRSRRSGDALRYPCIVEHKVAIKHSLAAFADSAVHPDLSKNVYHFKKAVRFKRLPSTSFCLRDCVSEIRNLTYAYHGVIHLPDLAYIVTLIHVSVQAFVYRRCGVGRVSADG